MFHNNLLLYTTAYFASYTNCPYILFCFSSEKLIHHLCSARENIFIFHMVDVIPEGFVSEKYHFFL